MQFVQEVYEMSKIELGKTKSGKIIEFDYVPHETRGILIQGISRSRKSSSLKELLKRSKNIPEKPQHIIFDVTPEFGYLRKFYEHYLIVGKNGEIPLLLDRAYEIGTWRENKMDVIFSVAEFKEEEEREQFIDQVLDAIQNVDTQYWKNPAWVVIDEAQALCTNSKKTKCRDSIVNLCQQGVKRGLLPIIATQGIKDFYKNARVQLDNRIIGYTH